MKVASTPSISLPVDVSSIGSVAERSEIPRDFRCAQQREVIVLLSGEPRQVEDDDELEFAFIGAAELQQLLQLGAIGGLRALAFLAESREHVEALTLAVLFAGLVRPVPRLLASVHVGAPTRVKRQDKPVGQLHHQ